MLTVRLHINQVIVDHNAISLAIVVMVAQRKWLNHMLVIIRRILSTLYAPICQLLLSVLHDIDAHGLLEGHGIQVCLVQVGHWELIVESRFES